MSQPPARGDVLTLVHHHPGRLRLRSLALVDDDGVAALAKDALVKERAVRRVDHDPNTGSVLVEYEPGGVAPDALLAIVAEATGLLIDAREPVRPERAHGERFVDACRSFNAVVYERTGFVVEPRTLLPVTVLGLSAVFFVLNRGQRMPRWDNLAYWSLSLFSMLHAPEVGRSRHRPATESAEGPE